MVHRIGFLLALAATIMSLATDIEKKDIRVNPSNSGIIRNR